MNEHTALENLPAILNEMGFNVRITYPWLEGQGEYLWTDPWTEVGSYENPPSAYMVHHTGGVAATPPPSDISKANAWIGLERGDRLYASGGGVPTIVLSSAGPCRISSGYGYRPAAWDYTFKGTRAPWKAEGLDSEPKIALNRYAFNMEAVHPGNGSPLDDGVWDAVVGLGVALHNIFGWTEGTISHRGWTLRKIDPYWNGDYQAIIAIQDAIAAQLGDSMAWADDWTDNSWMTWFNDTDIPGVNGEGRYYCKNDGTYDFIVKTGVAWGGNPIDGKAEYREKLKAINHVFSGLAIAVGGSA